MNTAEFKENTKELSRLRQETLTPSKIEILATYILPAEGVHNYLDYLFNLNFGLYNRYIKIQVATVVLIPLDKDDPKGVNFGLDGTKDHYLAKVTFKGTKK